MTSPIRDIAGWPKAESLRPRLYDGEILCRTGSPAALRLAQAVNRELAAAFEDTPSPAHAALHLPAAEFFTRIKQVRTRLADTEFRELQRDLLVEAGWLPGEHAFDQLRLRAIVPRPLVTPAMKAAYDLHRDTWFANPYSQVNWWLPLHDIVPEQSFAFFPDVFRFPVENNSAEFDYREFVTKAGWQSTKGGTGAVYPTVIGSPELGSMIRFSLEHGGVLLFSAAHLHATQLNDLPTCRYSLDFRLVNVRDRLAGTGAPNVDGRASGDASEDYLNPGRADG